MKKKSKIIIVFKRSGRAEKRVNSSTFKLRIVDIALRGLNIRKERNELRLTVLLFAIRGNKDETTIMKSRIFQPSRR